MSSSSWDVNCHESWNDLTQLPPLLGIVLSEGDAFFPSDLTNLSYSRLNPFHLNTSDLFRNDSIKDDA